MERYYVLRRGLEFKTMFIDAATATLWFKHGWELSARQFVTHEEAQLEMERWKLAQGKKMPHSTASGSQLSLY